MSTLWMMIGVPASGKSTWISNHNFDWNNTVIISTDAIIEQKAKDQNKTYNEVFLDEIKAASAEMDRILDAAVRNNIDIVWDQTNLSKKVRKQKLDKIPKNYKKVAVYFATPSDSVLTKRLESRPGKNIPKHIIASMIKTLEPPSIDEGFDEIRKYL